MVRATITIETPSKLKQVVELAGDMSIGRARDNAISIDNTSISRYHSLIEERPDGYWLSDLGSVNGTLVNGKRIVDRWRLKDGDIISLGENRLFFQELIAKQAERDKGNFTANSSSLATVATTTPVANQSTTTTVPTTQLATKWLITAVVIGVSIMAIVAVWLLRGSNESTRGSAQIINPSSGTTVRAPIKVQLEVKNPSKIEQIIYQLDGVPFETVVVPPFDITLDPEQLAAKFTDLGNGNHVLSVMVQGVDGRKDLQAETLILAFQLKEQTTEDSSPAQGGSVISEPAIGGATINIAAMTQSLASQLSQKSGYQFSPQLLEQIRGSTGNYRSDYISDARRYRREIIKAFRDKGLHPLFGFVLAMSQSRFRGEGANRGIAIWGMSPEIARGYLSAGETESTFSDPQRCAEIAASYFKDLINLFGQENFMYAIACYGLPINRAGQVRVKLEEYPINMRNDFSSMVERGLIAQGGNEQLIKFYAAGIVGENPQAFGLQYEHLSSLY